MLTAAARAGRHRRQPRRLQKRPGPLPATETKPWPKPSPRQRRQPPRPRQRRWRRRAMDELQMTWRPGATRPSPSPSGRSGSSDAATGAARASRARASRSGTPWASGSWRDGGWTALSTWPKSFPLTTKDVFTWCMRTETSSRQSAPQPLGPSSRESARSPGPRSSGASCTAKTRVRLTGTVWPSRGRRSTWGSSNCPARTRRPRRLRLRC
mmetsp:Transcript_66630/g.150492  ORF Transcript_66630/g.150492 Transcript_66630/m.150492 type:complete len:211 (+) Transcript_66630:334-966(+)